MKAKKLVKKLSKLKIKKGNYQGTNGMGHDMYGAPYYSVEEVTKLIKEAKKYIKKNKSKVQTLF